MPETDGVLARALLQAPEHKLALLPAGEARLEAAGTLDIATAKGPKTLSLYRISGLDFTPRSVWLDADGNTAALITASGWFSVLSPEYRDSLADLITFQERASADWSLRLARELTHVPEGPLLIRNARLYDPRDLSVMPNTSVLIEGERVVRVAADAALKAPPNAEILDASGRFLMPGLWDVHKHYADADGALDIANGVTSSRDRAEVRDFIAFLKRNHTVLDPTMGIEEDLLAGDPKSKTPPGLKTVGPRLPPQVQRDLSWGALKVPEGEEHAYEQAFPTMLRLLKALHDAGVTILPGTDALAGYMLHSELILYARAGIPNAEVLRLATLTPAQVLGVAKDRGVIAPGKLADLVLIDGDPITDMNDIRKVDAVFKGGKRFDPAQIERALGIVPRKTAAEEK
ncbi:amidohydrolase family protein [Luteimonas sp. R10]|uniref:amidohydrolase family protein n=1 Tax=Luteimonas sp. R10 TaxID=3108176 RepID=UPI003088B4BC|nr:amidohydrolase family protein [Luteimonas sp. R10]